MWDLDGEHADHLIRQLSEDNCEENNNTGDMTPAWPDRYLGSVSPPPESLLPRDTHDSTLLRLLWPGDGWMTLETIFTTLLLSLSHPRTTLNWFIVLNTVIWLNNDCDQHYFMGNITINCYQQLSRVRVSESVDDYELLGSNHNGHKCWESNEQCLSLLRKHYYSSVCSNIFQLIRFVFIVWCVRYLAEESGYFSQVVMCHI